MSYFAFDPETSPEPSGTPSEPPNADSDPRLNRALLEKVLHETLNANKSNVTIGVASLTALREVARRHRGQPFALEPVAVQLVQAMLRVSLPKRAQNAREWETMSIKIAQTMLDNPVTRDRLKAFWGRLSELDT